MLERGAGRERVGQGRAALVVSGSAVDEPQIECAALAGCAGVVRLNLERLDVRLPARLDPHADALAIVGRVGVILRESIGNSDAVARASLRGARQPHRDDETSPSRRAPA